MPVLMAWPWPLSCLLPTATLWLGHGLGRACVDGLTMALVMPFDYDLDHAFVDGPDRAFCLPLLFGLAIALTVALTLPVLMAWPRP